MLIFTVSLIVINVPSIAHQKYFLLVVLVVPLFLSLVYGCFFIFSYINLFYRLPFKEMLLIDIVNDKIPDKQIFPLYNKICGAPLKEVILEVYKSFTKS